MSAERILLVGAGGHARACIDVIEQEQQFVIAGLIGLAHEGALSVLGYRVLGTDEDLSKFTSTAAYALVTLGQIKSPVRRRELFEMCVAAGFGLSKVVSPRGYLSPHAKIGEGTIVMHGAVVNAGAVVGRNCIVNSNALIEHDVVIGDHCHISTTAAVNSGVRIGAGTFIGSSAVVRQGLSIGRECVIGMGHRVFTDCADGAWIPPRKTLP